MKIDDKYKEIVLLALEYLEEKTNPKGDYKILCREAINHILKNNNHEDQD